MSVLLIGMAAALALAIFAPRGAIFLGACLLCLAVGAVGLSYLRDTFLGAPHDMEPIGMAATLGLFGGLPLGAALLALGLVFRR